MESARQQFGIDPGSSSISKKKFQQWSDNQVLAYLDLYTWSKEEGIELDNASIAEWIPPRQHRDTGLGEDTKSTVEKARRTMRSNALDLMDETLLQELANELYSGEIREEAEMQAKLLASRMKKNTPL